MKFSPVILLLAYTACGPINKPAVNQIAFADDKKNEKDPFAEQRKDPKDWSVIKEAEIRRRDVQPFVDAIVSRAGKLNDEEKAQNKKDFENSLTHLADELIREAVTPLRNSKILTIAKDSDVGFNLKVEFKPGTPLYLDLLVDDVTVGFLRLDYKLDAKNKVESVDVSFKKITEKK